MKVTIIDNFRIRNIILPNKIMGSYWITEFDENGIERNLISIEPSNNGWKLVSNNEIFVYENNVMTPEVILKEYSFYVLKNEAKKTSLMLYISPVYDNSFLMYDISSLNEVLIGSNNDNHISYSLLDDICARIIKNNEKFQIVDNSSKFGIYVNNVKVDKCKDLQYGDVIFILGLKLILIKINNTLYIVVNNPRGITKFNGLISQNIPIDNEVNINDNEELVDMELYSDDDYFHKKPRFTSSVETLKMSIDAPPSKKEDEESSAIMTIGPMLTMSLTSLVTGYTAVNNIQSGRTTMATALPSLIICVVMFASIFIWPLLIKMYNKSKKKRQEKKRQKKYSNYIDGKRKIISDELIKQKQILMNNYPSLAECQNIILNNQVTLWQRRIRDDDFLTVNLGYGNYPMKIDIKYPEEHFSMEEDNLKDIVNKLGSEPKILKDAPFSFSLFENNISAVIGKSTEVSEYVRRLILQIITFHSYDDLKIVFLTNKDKEYNWEFAKALPHTFSNDKEIRFLATDNDEYKEVCYYLENLLNKRIEDAGTKTINKTDYKPIYLIVTDCIKSVRNYDVIKKILESQKNYGFSLLILNEKISNIPDQCQSFIKIENSHIEYITNENNIEPQKLMADLVTPIDMYECAKKLLNIPIEFNDDSDSKIPDKLGFLEMYDVGEVEQLNAPNRWKKSNPMLSLGSAVGYGKNGEKIVIDLHEKYHGPHGLIAGMTGSGKSEFIITYILSMAINYHPYEVQFILIDYKGGGLTGAFENPTTGIKLPHLVGTITNLDANEIKRSLASIESELKRRQKLFNIAREASGESTVDIYKYQKMYREGIVKEPISHLFIISDEFAELKKEQPEFMTQLISTARIGRSLGVHLILATQKPSGVVDPQIWSNTRFRICLRVQDKSDSTEVIKCPDAAYLKNTGRFYFQVGYNEIFELGQAAYAGGKYFPSKKIKKNIDTTINFINNIGYSVKTVETRKKINLVSNGEELPNILNYLYSCFKEENLSIKPLWLPTLPSYINIENLMKKYNYTKENYIINPVIGEYDVPSRQEQHLLSLNFSENGNVCVYGNAGSGKENLITTMIYSSMLLYSPKELNYYILDFGSETLKIFKDCPLVGNVLNIDNNEEINNLFGMIEKEIDNRKKLFNDYNGDYINYCKVSGNTIPSIIVVINNYETYQESYSEYDEKLNILSRESQRYGIYFMLTVSTPNGVRFKLRQNFQQIFSLGQNSADDYITIMGNVNKTYPSKIFGRGIIRLDDIYEFQTALVSPIEEINKTIKEKCTEYLNKYKEKAKEIPVLPETIKYENIKNEVGVTNELVVGISKESLEIVKYNFDRNYVTLFSGNDMLLFEKPLNALINQILLLGRKSLYVINSTDLIIDQKFTPYYNYINNNFDNYFDQIEKYLERCYENYINNGYNREIFKDVKPITCIIIGLDSFKNKLNDQNKTKFGNLFEKGKDLGIINFIIVDTIDIIKKYEYESWYKTTVNSANGIWIGNGINDQFTFKISQKTKEMREEIGDLFGFVIKRGKPELIKFVSEITLNVKSGE